MSRSPSDRHVERPVGTETVAALQDEDDAAGTDPGGPADGATAEIAGA